MFRIYPAVDIKGGKCVQLQQGDPSKVLFSVDDPVKVAEFWVEKGAKALHVIDLDGAFEGKLKNEDIILKIAELAEIQVGGGIRSIDIAEKLLKNGVNRVIVGTLALKEPEAVRKLAKDYPNRVIISIDTRDDKVVVNGWRAKTELSPIEVAKLFDDLEVSFLLTDVNVEGLMKGVRKEFIKEVVASLKKDVIVSGGVSSYEDAKLIKELGASGVVIGSALYLGKVKFEELLELEEL